MQTKVEGLLIHKVPQGERNLVGKLLLRSGKIISVIFYGGQGGGKKLKPSSLELGYMLKIDLKPGKVSTAELLTAKEWQVIWSYSKIRLNHLAYYQMCFYFEFVSKISTADNLYDENRDYDNSLEGVFRVLSNAVFYLEKALESKNFDKHSHLAIFLSKLIMELGVNPTTDECVFCGGDLNSFQDIFLTFEQGGFICENCVSSSEGQNLGNMPGGGKELHDLFKKIVMMKYKEYGQITSADNRVNQLLLNYLFYQFGLEQASFKTIPFVL